MNYVSVNGCVVPASEARVSVFDRGFLYGDGLFETVRVQSGKPFRWTQHLARLRLGLRSIRIRLWPDDPELTREAAALIAANQCVDGVLRVSVSRGVGLRGYSPTGAGTPTLVMSLHPRTADPRPGLRLITASLRVMMDDSLAAVKSASKLRHVLARAEADEAGVDDALLLNQRGEVAEVTSGNVFWLENGTICTPPIEAGVLPGVARGALFEIAPALGIPTVERTAGPELLAGSDGVFVTNVVSGPVEVAAVDGRDVRRSRLFGGVRNAFEELVERASGPRAG